MLTLAFCFALEVRSSQEAPSFERQVLSSDFTCEGASFADLDRDGHADVIAGPFWYRGPSFEEKRELYAPKVFDPKGYSDNFFAFPRDFDGDGWLDLLCVGFPGEAAHWFRNPEGKDEHWKKHMALAQVDNESPTFTDLTGDGEPELVCHTAGRLGWAAPDPARPNEPWAFHPLSGDLELQRFTHGMGVGDVNGDGRADVLLQRGWWEQPSSLAGDPAWQEHAFAFSSQYGGAQMFVYDVDADGWNDVVTSLAAHHFGLSWWRQVRPAGAIEFVEQRIMGAEPAENADGVCFGELHALDLVDVDQDGMLDIVTGKRWWSHGAEGDPQPGSQPVVYWFGLERRRVDGTTSVRWHAHRVDAESGVGVQVVAGDVTGDGRVDVVVGNKRGAFVLKQRAPDADPEH